MLFIFLVLVFWGTASAEPAAKAGGVTIFRTGPVNSFTSGFRRFREFNRNKELVREFWDQSIYMKQVYSNRQLRLAEISFSSESDIVRGVIRFLKGKFELLSVVRVRNPVFCLNNCGPQKSRFKFLDEFNNLLDQGIEDELKASQLFAAPSCRPPSLSSEAQNQVAKVFAQLVSTTVIEDSFIGCVDTKLLDAELADDMKVSLMRLKDGQGLQMNCDPVAEGAKFDGVRGVLHYGPPFQLSKLFHELGHVASAPPEGAIRTEQRINAMVECCGGAKLESSCVAARKMGMNYELPGAWRASATFSEFFDRQGRSDGLIVEFEKLGNAEIAWRDRYAKANPCIIANPRSKDCQARADLAYNLALSDLLKPLCEMPEANSIERCFELPTDYPEKYSIPNSFVQITSATLAQAEQDRMNQVAAQMPRTATVQQIPVSLDRGPAARQESAFVAALGGKTYAPESAVGQWFEKTVGEELRVAAMWREALIPIAEAHAAEPPPPTKPNTPTTTTTVFSNRLPSGSAKSATSVRLPPSQRYVSSNDRVRGGKPVVADLAYSGVNSVDRAAIDMGESQAVPTVADGALGQTPQVSLSGVKSAPAPQSRGATSASSVRKQITPRGKGPQPTSGEFGNGAPSGPQASQVGAGTASASVGLSPATKSGKASGGQSARDVSQTNSASGSPSELPQIVTRYLARRGTTVKGSIESRDRDFEALLRDNGLQFIAGDRKVGAREKVKAIFVVDPQGNVLRSREEAGP